MNELLKIPPGARRLEINAYDIDENCIGEASFVRSGITTQLAEALEGCIAMLKKDSIDSEVAYYTGMMGEEDPVKYAQYILARYHGGKT